MEKENFNYLDKALDEELRLKREQIERKNNNALLENQYVGTEAMQEDAQEKEKLRLEQELERKLVEHRKVLEARYFENHGGSRDAAYKELIGDKQLTNQFEQAAKQQQEQQRTEQQNQQVQKEHQEKLDRDDQKKKKLKHDFQAANQNKLQEQRNNDAAKRAQIREQYNLANRQERNRGIER